jgi:hypothetical protein
MEEEEQWGKKREEELMSIIGIIIKKFTIAMIISLHQQKRRLRVTIVISEMKKRKLKLMLSIIIITVGTYPIEGILRRIYMKLNNITNHQLSDNHRIKYSPVLTPFLKMKNPLPPQQHLTTTKGKCKQ